ncbi:hypothetical protein KSK37_08285 [Kaistella sp. DKR-2]|uniref:hypothetical protein n=1 Tax=Kaistella soli TaxID=2849654 RepID=UPI001C2541C5|nr:hypothetical protein [Kaistella soli]MBU8883077.1 hypothetical protein [Kaistella soli]
MRKSSNLRALRKSISQRKEEIILVRSAKNAGSNATRSSRALGLAVKIIKDHEIITVQPDKTEKVIRSIHKSSIDISKLRKGLILHRR